MNLFKALSYKEWIKTRKAIVFLFLLAIAVLAYVFIDVTHSIRLEESVNVWYGYLYMGKKLPIVMMVYPILAGLALALVQFVPEMVDKRLKLTLHLPANETSIVAAMLMYGYVLLLGLFALIVIALVVGMNSLFSFEINQLMLSQFLPWLVSGLVAYGFTAWICFEPQWKQRVLNLIIAVGLLSVLFVSQNSDVYLHFGLGMLVLLVASFTFPFYSAMRFKHGVLQ